MRGKRKGGGRGGREEGGSERKVNYSDNKFYHSQTNPSLGIKVESFPYFLKNTN